MARVPVVTRLTRREYEALQLLAQQEARSLSGCVRFLVRRTLANSGLLGEKTARMAPNDSGAGGLTKCRAEREAPGDE